VRALATRWLPDYPVNTYFASLEAAALAVIDQAEVSEDLLTQDRQDMAQSRRADVL